MFRIKRLYTFMLQRFVPVFAMTFFISLFVVLMQFLWRTIDELVGKGLSVDVLGELFFYAALTMVPTALPLAILLASLMTFGNLGEKFELTAMKASGVSLFRIMRPLIVLMVLISIGAFFFQNNLLPVAQSRMYTLLFSVRQKSPEVEIPERSFYDQIPNMNLYVERKNPDTGMLYDMIIYDLSNGIDNARVILADSGKFNFTEDKTRLFLHLYHGEMFENLRDNAMGRSSARYMPFRRENFSDKQIYFAFDANFNRMDESGIRSQYVGQNISQLRRSIDSIGAEVDSIGSIYAADLKAASVMGIGQRRSYQGSRHSRGSAKTHALRAEDIDVDSVFGAPTPAMAKTYLTQALSSAKRQRQEYEFRSLALNDQAKLMRRHDIELQRKFTLSFACIIFFFIGAPLGAIIKKGGLGTPLVVSVLLFIFYFIVDNAGYKMARDGKVEVWEGIWLSSAVLLPLGVFFTYKAVGDSAVFNVDAYTALFRRLTGRELPRTLEVKEFVITEVETDEALRLLDAEGEAERRVRAVLDRRPPWRRRFASATVASVTPSMNNVVDYLSNSRDPRVIYLLNRYPFRATPRRFRDIEETTRLLTEHYQNLSQNQNGTEDKT